MGYSLRTARFRYTQWQGFSSGDVVATELYDHRNDPLETMNVVTLAKYSAVVAAHQKLLGSRLHKDQASP